MIVGNSQAAIIANNHMVMITRVNPHRMHVDMDGIRGPAAVDSRHLCECLGAID